MTKNGGRSEGPGPRARAAASGKKSVPAASGKKYLGAAGGWAVRNARAYGKR